MRRLKRLLRTPGATTRISFITEASRRLNYVCVGSGIRCEATHVSKNYSSGPEPKTIY